VRAAIEGGIALVPEDRKTQGLVLGMGIDHNATLAALRALCRRLLGIRRAEEAAAVDGLIHRLRVRARSRRQPALTLSGGNQQKVVLAKWLQAGAKVFLFDEPTRGIDVGARAEVYGLINELAAGGAAVLLVSSDLPELLGLSDRVLVLCEGRVAGELSAAEATPEKVLDLATAHARRVAAPREAS
jgi:ribose transport system ATP-binding protein